MFFINLTGCSNIILGKYNKINGKHKNMQGGAPGWWGGGGSPPCIFLCFLLILLYFPRNISENPDK